MELGAIRSRFIQTHLRRALGTADQALVWKTAYEFRRYFEWFACSMEERDRELISHQLRLLEGLHAGATKHDPLTSVQDAAAS